MSWCFEFESRLSHVDFALCSLRHMLDAPPIIDWSTDTDVMQIGRVADAQALEQGWCDAKVVGALSFPSSSHLLSI